MSDPATAYAESVANGHVVAGRLVRLACERHLRDLEEGPKRGLRWDVDLVHRLVEDFFPRLQLPEGYGPFILRPFQAFKTGSLFGWVSAKDGYRRFRTGYFEEGKGQGKTPWLGGCLLYGLVADNEEGAQCLAAAVTREQANLALRDAIWMAENSEFLQGVVDVSAHSVVHAASGSWLRAVSSEHRGLDGKRPHIAGIDELHEHPTPLVASKIRLGTKGRKQALIIEITNSGVDRTSVCWDHHQYGQQVVEGKIENDSHFAYICGLDPCEKHLSEGATMPDENCSDCDNWQDERVWPKANPGLGTILPIRYLREAVAEAQGMPSVAALVQRLNFCIWNQSVAGWFGADLWARNAAEEWPDLAGRDCFLGIDLASTTDTASVDAFFPDPGLERLIAADATEEEPEPSAEPVEGDAPPPSPVVGGWLVEMFFLPEDAIRARVKDARLPYDAWARDGHIRTTPGDSLDYDAILAYVDELQQLYTVREAAIDPWNSASLENSLIARGIVTVRVPPSELHLTEPTRRFELLVRRGLLRHRGNPVMSWQIGNVHVDRSPRGGLKISKDRSSEKVDGPAAAVLAISRAMLAPVGGSVYDTRGLLEVSL